MASSSSSSSDSENESPSRKRNASVTKPQRDSSDDTDFVSPKKVKLIKEKSTSTQNKDVSSTRSSFQQMFLNSNNKFVELLKNKRNTLESKKLANIAEPRTPVSNKIHFKNILGSDSNEKKKSSKTMIDSMIDFSPGASSTQIPDRSFDLGKSVDLNKSKQKSKKRPNETLSDSSSDSESSDAEKALVTKKSVEKSHRKRIVSERRSSSENTDSNNSKKKAKKKKKQKNSPNKVKQISKEDTDDSDSSVSEEEVATKRKSKSPQKTSHERSSHVESDSEDSDVVSPNSMSQLREFEASNESTVRVKEHLDYLKSSVLNKKVYLVQIPKALDPRSLVGTTISLNNNTKVPEKNKKYDCIPSNEAQNPVAVSFNAERIHVIKPVGNIKIQRRLKSKHIPEFPLKWNNDVVFPDNLKQRHPLFGADYTSKISLEQHIQEKLQAAIETHNKQKKKKKKKHKSENLKEENEGEEEEIFKFLSQTVSIKKEEAYDTARSEKLSISAGSSLEEDESGINSGKKKKKKKEKHISDFKVKMDYTNSESDQPKKKHKHKRIKEEIDVDTTDTGLFNTVVKQENFDESEIKFDVDGSPKKKKKKHHKEEIANSYDLIDQMLLTKSLEMTDSKKKKKHKQSIGVVI